MYALISLVLAAAVAAADGDHDGDDDADNFTTTVYNRLSSLEFCCWCYFELIRLNPKMLESALKWNSKSLISLKVFKFSLSLR